MGMSASGGGASFPVMANSVVVSSAGDDLNDGFTLGTPVKTLAKAMELAEYWVDPDAPDVAWPFADIVCPDGSVFNEDLTFTGFGASLFDPAHVINFYGNQCTINGDLTIATAQINRVDVFSVVGDLVIDASNGSVLFTNIACNTLALNGNVDVPLNTECTLRCRWDFNRISGGTFSIGSGANVSGTLIMNVNNGLTTSVFTGDARGPTWQLSGFMNGVSYPLPPEVE